MNYLLESVAPYLKRITKAQFDEGRNRRFGTTNPEKFDIAYWNLAVRYNIDPFLARPFFVKGIYGEGLDDDDDEEEEDSYTIDGRPFRADDDYTFSIAEDRKLSIADDNTSSIDDDPIAKDPMYKFFAAMEKMHCSTATPRQIDFEHAKYGDKVVGEGQSFGDPNANFRSNPIFCNLRMGETVTKLPDGTKVQIGGEHEDFFDPDFMVYNDVIVYPPGGTEFDIYGYPEAVFPPTDFHSATYVPALDSILVLGNMSSTEEDDALAARGITPVYLLKVGTWEFEKKHTHGDGPGIICNHAAEMVDGVLRVRAANGEESMGKTERKMFKGDKSGIAKVEDGETWELNLEDMTWKHRAGEWTTVCRKKKGRRG